MDTVAVRNPVALGLNVIVKVVLPLPTIDDDGLVVTVKSPAFAPPILTSVPPVKLSVAVPVFCIVNVLALEPIVTSTLPKSVSFVIVGVFIKVTS